MSNRREFFSLFVRSASERPVAPDGAQGRVVAAGLEPHTAPLTIDDAYHLLRRVTFAPTYALAQQLVGTTAQQAAETVLGTGQGTPPPSPGGWVDSATENPDNADMYTRQAIEREWEQNFALLQKWWAGLMTSEQFPASEKLTLFWSGHFTSEFTFDDRVIPPQLLYRQNQLIRSMRLGDFRQFAEEITLNGAMLMYLGGELNSLGRPNENYARELMELYTTGLGWYTEGDVQEAARVLTGWRIARFTDEPALNGIYNTYFSPGAHDIGAKQIMGESIAARTPDNNTEHLVRRDEVRELIAILFRQRPDAIAQFICRKLYHYFVYSKPSGGDEQVIQQLADVFRQNDFQIRPVVVALLSSAHFYDEGNRGVQIKTPSECLVGLARQFGVPSDSVHAVMASVEQNLMDPPNVAGWEGYRSWISTTTYPLRTLFAREYVQALDDRTLVDFARQFPDHTDADKLTAALERLFLPKPVSDKRHENYVQTLMQNAPVYEWTDIVTTDTAGAALRLRALMGAFIKAPDFQLC